MQCFNGECCDGCFFNCSCCLKTWKEFSVLGLWCRCNCDKQGNYKKDDYCTRDQKNVGQPYGSADESSNPMLVDKKSYGWKETQTDEEKVAGENEMSRSDDIGFDKLARQREELDAEWSKIIEERQQILFNLKALEEKKIEAEEIIELAALKEKEAAAGVMLQKALSRHAVSGAQQRRHEVEAVEHHAELLLKEAEEKRKVTEEIERANRRELAAMESLKNELIQTMQDYQLEFVKNKAELTSAGLESCQQILKILLRNPSMAICIDGHTNCYLDKCKDHCIHMKLSQQRVDVVKDQLKHGGLHNNIVTKGWGCKHPQIKNERAVHIYPVPKDHPALKGKMLSL